jgi:hypothetical protein
MPPVLSIPTVPSLLSMPIPLFPFAVPICGQTKYLALGLGIQAADMADKATE